MPSPAHFAQCPPFPADVAVAELPTISFSGLEANDPAVLSSLFSACRHHGFFLLDLRSSGAGTQLLSDAGQMFDLVSSTLNLPKPELDKFAYNPPRDLLGYKESGKLKTDDGRLDSTELYTLGQDDMLGTVAARRNPAPIEEKRAECQAFFRRAYGAVAVVLGALDGLLGLPRGTLAALSAPDKPSATSLRLLLTRPGQGSSAPVDASKVTLGAHTDIGLITLLFHVAGGLQILPAAAENKMENWRYIRPEPGCALVNLGDTLVEWTGGLLRSSLHRVFTAPGRQSEVERISLAYLIRPAHGESMKRLRSSEREVIPKLKEGEEEDTRTVDEWASERAGQIVRGILKPRTIGGAPVPVN